MIQATRPSTTRQARAITWLVVLGSALLPAAAGATGWGSPKPLQAAAEAAGLEPTGGPDGYWALTRGQDSASVFELPSLKPGVDLHQFVTPVASAVMAGNGRGDVVAAAGGNALQVARHGRDDFRDDRTLPGAGADIAAVGLGGDVAVGDLHSFAVAPPGETFGSPQMVTDGPVYASAAAVAPDGTVDFVTAADGHVTLYEQAPDEALTATKLATYNASTVDAVPAIAVAAGKKRALAIAWTQPARSDTTRRRATLLARTRTDHGRLGPVETLDHSRQADLSPQVAITSDGRAIAAWTSAYGGGLRAVRSAFSAPGPGSFGPPSTVSSFDRVRGGGKPSVSGRDARELDLAVGPRGAALVAWSAGCKKCDTKIEIAYATPGRTFGPPRVLSRINTLSARPYVAFDGQGGAAAAWTQSAPVTGADETAVVARAPVLTDDPPPHDVRPPHVRLRPREGGDAVVRTGKLHVRTDCDETCAVQIDLKGEVAATGTHGTALLISVPERSQQIAADLRRNGYTTLGWTATDRTGNVSYGRLRLHR